MKYEEIVDKNNIVWFLMIYLIYFQYPGGQNVVVNIKSHGHTGNLLIEL